MMKYTLSTPNENQHFLDITFEVEVKGKNIVEVQLPAWRPGRYELGNFAKNIQKFKVLNEQGKPLVFEKITKDRWRIETLHSKKIIVEYNYYAVKFDAGSTFVGDDVVYVNPVNCFLYVDEFLNDPCDVILPVKEHQQIAGLNNVKGNLFKAISYHEVVDSPFIISTRLQKENYQVLDYEFVVWFYGECKPQWNKLLPDFKKFTTYQIEKFGSFPSSRYHFLNIIHPYSAYHGVEHLNSTVITLGPSYDIFDKLYIELLGISSHELYHVWNIKTIRPSDMMPYSYTKENYSRLGYVAEGVTTYMGDLVLYESGVISKEQYINEFNQYLSRHFLNDGRLNLSVAESSFDTWLDGYDMGIPNRKSSIYVEGALVAFMTDMNIRKNSNGAFSLHDVMKELYVEFGIKQIGYNEENYKKTVEKYLRESWEEFYRQYVNAANDFEEELSKWIDFFGLMLVKNKSLHVSHQLGFVFQKEAERVKIIHVKEGSISEKSGLTRGDIIISINGIMIKEDLNQWLNYFVQDPIELCIEFEGRHRIINLTLIENKNQFYSYSVC